MWPDRVSNPGPPTYESGALPIALRGPATISVKGYIKYGLENTNKTNVCFIFIDTMSNMNLSLLMIAAGLKTQI